MSVDFSRIIRVTNGVAGEGTDMEKKFELFTTDSREINGQSALFVAFKGEKNDAQTSSAIKISISHGDHDAKRL